MEIILIHPNILGHKFKFEESYIKTFQESCWFGTVSEFGDWWSARSNIQIDTEDLGNVIKVKMTVPDEIKGLEIITPFGYEFYSAPSIADIKKTSKGLLLGKVSSSAELIFKKIPDYSVGFNK